MIKFFRRIRKHQLAENKFSNYLLYAIGEIILVVIGILIALQINNWNESNSRSKKELALLGSLKNDIDADVLNLKREDSLYSKLEADSKISIKLFYEAETIKDIDSVSSLTNASLWNELYINRNTYDEMIGSAILYSIKNKELQEAITKYYLNEEANRNYLREVNGVQSHLWDLTPEIHPYKLLTSQLENPQIDLKLIDTTWINNPNSPTYLAVNNYLNSNHDANNRYRRSVYQRIIKEANKLSAAIADELEHRNK